MIYRLVQTYQYLERHMSSLMPMALGLAPLMTIFRKAGTAEKLQPPMDYGPHAGG